MILFEVVEVAIPILLFNSLCVIINDYSEFPKYRFNKYTKILTELRFNELTNCRKVVKGTSIAEEGYKVFKI